MTQRKAASRYMKRLIPATVVYLVGIFATSWANKTEALPQWSIYGLTLIPALAILVWMWAHWRYVHEIDEYMRSIQHRAMLIGITILMAVSSFWGLLEFFGDVPAIPIFYVLPAYYIFYGLAQAVIAKREGVKGICL